MTLKKQLNEAIKALKAEMKMKKMEEAVRHADEKERISREYAEQLEALINCVTEACLLYTSPSPRDRTRSRMPSSA